MRFTVPLALCLLSFCRPSETLLRNRNLRGQLQPILLQQSRISVFGIHTSNAHILSEQHSKGISMASYLRVSIITLGSWILCRRRALASVAMSISRDSSVSTMPPTQGLIIWATLFLASATLHAAESAITKISPWKVSSINSFCSYTTTIVTLTFCRFKSLPKKKAQALHSRLSQRI
jgi:hypothetical protein